jgi:hypothetical protein
MASRRAITRSSLISDSGMEPPSNVSKWMSSSGTPCIDKSTPATVPPSPPAASGSDAAPPPSPPRQAAARIAMAGKVSSSLRKEMNLSGRGLRLPRIYTEGFCNRIAGVTDGAVSLYAIAL